MCNKRQNEQHDCMQYEALLELGHKDPISYGQA